MMFTHDGDALRGLSAAALVLAVLAVAPAAHAITDQERWAASQAFTKAQDLKKKGQLQEALAQLEQSHRLDPKLKTLMELADTEEQLGKLLEAKEHFAAARDKAKQEQLPQSRQRAEERLSALEKRVPQLTLQLAADTPPDAQVLLNDTPLDAAALAGALTLNPGDHLVVVRVPGRDDATYPVKLVDGDNQTLAIAAVPKAAPPPPPPPPPPRAAPAKTISSDELSASASTGSTRRTLGVVLGAAGVVGLGVGGGFWAVGWRDRSQLGPASDRNIRIGQISAISGAVLLASGIVLYATAPSGSTRDARQPIVPTLSVARDATLLGAAGEF